MPDEFDDALNRARSQGGGAGAPPADEFDEVLSRVRARRAASTATAPTPASVPSTVPFGQVEAPLRLKIAEGDDAPTPDTSGEGPSAPASFGRGAKTVAAALGGTVVKGVDTVAGGLQDLMERGVGSLGGSYSKVPDTSNARPGGVPRPIYEATDTVLAALPKWLVGDTPPTLDQAEEFLREDPDIRAGLEFADKAGPVVGDTYGMLRGGGKIGRGIAATAPGKALNATRTGRVLTHATTFGTASAAMAPDDMPTQFANGVLASLGGQGAARLAAPWLARVLTKANAAGNANPLFVRAMKGAAEGLGQSAAPHIQGGAVHSALLEGDFQTVAINLALNTMFDVAAKDVPHGIKIAYIKGRAGEVPPQYRARLDALAGPIYDGARAVRAETAKAEAGAKPWTAADEAAARAEIHAGGATGKVAEAQLAKAKRGTYDADLVTDEVLAGGMGRSVNDAAGEIIARDKAAFARTVQDRVEAGLDPTASLVAGRRETEALEMGEAAVEGQATREAARAAVEPGDPEMLSRPLGAPAPPEPAAARQSPPGPAAEPTLSPIGKTTDGRTVFGKGDKFYVRGTGGRLGAAHPKDVAEAQAAPEAPVAPREEGTILAGTKRKPRLKSADTLEAEATKNVGLAQLVRREGGIDLTGTNLTGEVNGLRLKESGTTGLVAPNGGGRSKSVQRLMDAAREEGFDLEGWTETQFVERVLSDAQGDRTLNPAVVGEAKLGEATLRRRVEEEEARWANAPPGAREQHEAESRARIDEILAERKAQQDADVRWATDDYGDDVIPQGSDVVGTTREGDPVTGTVVRETDRSLIVDTPDGQRSVPKSAARKDPGGIYLGSGFGGAQQFAEAAGPAIAAGAKAIGRGVRGVADWVTMQTVPKMNRASPVAARYAGGIINGSTTSHLVAPVWVERVFGENPTAETLAKFGHAAGEFQFNAKRKQLEADLATSTSDVERARIEDKLDRIGSVIGAEGSPFATQADLDSYMATPEWKSQSEAWRAEWNKANIVEGDMLPGPERMYQDWRKRNDGGPDLFTSDERDILRVNMKPMEPTEDGGTRPVYRTATGSLKAPMLKGHAFSREFTGGAAKYDFDPIALIQNTYQRVHSEWLKPKMYAEMVRTGDAERTDLKSRMWKPPTKIKGEDVVAFPITQSRLIVKDGKSFVQPGETLYVRKSLAPELRQTLRTDAAADQFVVAQALNTAALTGIADNVWNLMLDSMIPASAPGHIPGKLGAQAGIANNIVGLFKQIKYTVRRPKDFNERALRLSADASWRGARGEEWTLKSVRDRLANMGSVGGVLKEWGGAKLGVDALGRLSQRVHEAGRLVLDEAYTNVLKAGLAKDTPNGRREFVNRLGQYAGRAMDRFTEAARDLGAQPFVVAKKKSLAEVGRKATFSPGVEAKGKSEAFQLRLGQFMRLFTFAGVTGAVNMAYTGSPSGRPGTPLGNLDFGTNVDPNDPESNPISYPIFANLTGQGPMLRATGAVGAKAAKDQNLTNAEAADAGIRGPLNAVVLKWLSSPTSDFISRIVAGKTIPQALGGGGGPTAEPPHPGKAGFGQRVAFALRQGAQLGPVVTQGIDKALGTKLTPGNEPDPTNEFLDLAKNFAPKRGQTADMLKAMPAIIQRKKTAEWAEWAAMQRTRFTNAGDPAGWWKWVNEEIKDWPDEAKYGVLKDLQYKQPKPAGAK